jgi:tetratricopeptide (TPR) repeat protein
LACVFTAFFYVVFSMTAKSKTIFGFIRAICLALLVFMGLPRPAFAVDTNAAPAEISAQDFLRFSLLIQEQLHATQLEIETNRQEAVAAAASNSLLLDDRLRLMEKTAATEHLEQLSRIDHSERTILMVSGGFAVMGFLVLLLAAFLHWTAVNRLAVTAASLSAYPPPGLGAGEPAARALEQSNTRFLGLIERLEQRMDHLETSIKLPTTASENGESNGSATESVSTEISHHGGADKADPINLLISKSQTLLKLAKPEAAVGCLDEVLTLDPGNADALVKKGIALEHLQLLDQAIQCYDRAIAQDNSMTMAYLHKGGILNRLERHSEALACYEQALQLGKTSKPQNA